MLNMQDKHARQTAQNGMLQITNEGTHMMRIMSLPEKRDDNPHVVISMMSILAEAEAEAEFYWLNLREAQTFTEIYIHKYIDIHIIMMPAYMILIRSIHI